MIYNYSQIYKEQENILNQLIIDSFSSKNATRSSNRTNNLHELIKDSIKSNIHSNKEQYIINSDHNKKESLIKDGYNNTISCDLIIKNKEDENNSDIIIMVKAPMTSINKNINNYYNGMYGESIRILAEKNNQNKKVIFLNFIPRKNFILNSKGHIIRSEKTKRMKNLELEDFGILKDKMSIVNIYYDLNKAFFSNNIKNKQDILKLLKKLSLENKSLVENLDIDSYLNEIKKINRVANNIKSIKIKDVSENEISYSY